MPVKLIAKVASHHLADSPIFVILFCLVVTSAALIITIGPMAAQQHKKRKEPLKMWLSLQNVQIGINGISVDADLIVKNNNQKVVTLEEITLYFTENNEIHANLDRLVPIHTNLNQCWLDVISLCTMIPEIYNPLITLHHSCVFQTGRRPHRARTRR